MKTLAVALLLATSPLAAQVCPTYAPFPTEAIAPATAVEGSSVTLRAQGGVGECPYPPYPPPPNYCRGWYFIQSCDTVQWTFGDGSTATVVGSDSATHTYAHAGVYNVSVHISNSLGSVDMANEVYVTSSPATTIRADNRVDATEGTSMTVHVVRGGNLSRTNRVDWRLRRDFQSHDQLIPEDSGTFTFAPGETDHSLTFPTGVDGQYWGDDYAFLYLDLTDGPIGISQGYGIRHLQSTLVVHEVDPIPVGIFRDVTVRKGSASVRVPLDLTHEFATPCCRGDVDYRTINGSARDGVDFVGSQGQAVSVPPDTTKAFIEIPLKANVIPGRRTFDVEIYWSSFPMLRSRATVTIADDAPAIVADVQQLSLPLGAYGKITLSPASPQTDSFVVNLASSDPAVVPVPATMLIPADRPAELLLHGINTGHATITITGGGGQTATVEVQVVQVRRRAVR